MPFSPLPATLVDEVTRCAPGGVLELGSGHGAFTSILQGLGCRPWTLDRRGPPLGGRPQVIGDAMSPPFCGGFALVIAANLLRHVWRGVVSDGPGVWQRLVAPGGRLWILEDEPCDQPRSARNYRDLQGLLAELQPGRHGRLLPRRAFEDARGRWGQPDGWATGLVENTWPADVDEVIAMLAAGQPAAGQPEAGQPEAGGPVAALRASLERSGLSYGRYWWACWRHEGAR